jgi:hypothetical protein
MRTTLPVLALLVLSACPDRPVSAIQPHQSGTDTQQIPLSVNRKVDILFVIDNSISMRDEQASLVANFDAFMTKLENIEGGLPSVHIGVVSSDVGVGGGTLGGNCTGQGDDGKLQNTPRGACTPPSGFFISDEIAEDGVTRVKNYSGTLEDTFACIAELGDDGCGMEQHLEAMKRALDGHRPENNGFLRQDAWLAVVIIADEDDCSAKDPAIFSASTDDATLSQLGPVSFRCTEWGITCDGAPLSRDPATYPGECAPRADSPYLHDPLTYAAWLRDLKQGRDLVMVAGIVGALEPVQTGVDAQNRFGLLPSCGAGAGGNGGAVPPVRMQAFFDAFGHYATVTSICNSSLEDALTQIATRLAIVVGTRCISDGADLTDLFPANPGIQPECAVTSMIARGTPAQEETPIARCTLVETASGLEPAAGSPRPCWYLHPSDSCDTESGLAIEVVDPPHDAPDAELIVSCAAK